MIVVRGESFNRIQKLLLPALLRAPDFECAPRGMKIRECLATTVVLANPRARLSTSPARAAKYAFAAGEFCWYLRGARDLESIAHYNPRMRNFSDDGQTLHSAYGYRLGLGCTSEDGLLAGWPQWADCLRTLLADRDSRRAVMTIYSPQDMWRACLSSGTKDVPCTLSIQALIRAEPGGPPRLHWVVTMRSNDAVWGLANDLFSFTLLQEAMMLELREAGIPDLELGTYVHQAGSMHVYERHFDLCEAVEKEGPLEPGVMEPIASTADLRGLLAAERVLRAPRFPGEVPYVGVSGGGARQLLGWLRDAAAKKVG